jgi:hypothetical protein
MKTILNIKHWQLFMLICGVQIIITTLNDFDYVYRRITYSTAIDLVGMFVGISFFVFWLWSVSIVLNRKQKTEIKLNVSLFKISTLLFVANILITSILILGATSEEFLLVLTLISFGFFIYAVLFTAKTLKTTELRRVAGISEYIGDFLLFILFPLGIWFLQPRINKISDAL